MLFISKFSARKRLRVKRDAGGGDDDGGLGGAHNGATQGSFDQRPAQTSLKQRLHFVAASGLAGSMVSDAAATLVFTFTFLLAVATATHPVIDTRRESSMAKVLCQQNVAGVKFFGAELGPPQQVGSWEDCEDKCSENPGCHWIDLDKADMSCQIKSGRESPLCR